MSIHDPLHRSRIRTSASLHRSRRAPVVAVAVLVLAATAAFAQPPATGKATELSLPPDWIFDGEAQFNLTGNAVASAGDVDGDGYDDVLVGADGYASGAGRAYLFLGGPDGLDRVPSWTADGSRSNDFFGHSVAAAGDVNGDGLGDVITGAYGYDNGHSFEGRASVYLGTSTGLSDTAVWTSEGEQEGAKFGFVVAGVGDVNGDGYDDVLATAFNYSTGLVNAGRVYVYYGSPTGPSRSADWTLTGGANGAKLGWRAGGAGDVNGDGYFDVIVAASIPDTDHVGPGGQVRVYYGSADGLGTQAAWTIGQDSLGSDVATAGDVNGDGYGDVLVGEATFSGDRFEQGRVVAYYGSSDGLATGWNWSAEGERDSARLGTRVRTAGDIDGDGYDEVVLSAPYFSGPSNDDGFIAVYYGSAGGLATTARTVIDDVLEGPALGLTGTTAGDVDADGFSDLLLGAPGYSDSVQLRGRAYLYYGDTAGIVADVGEFTRQNSPTLVLTTVPNPTTTSITVTVTQPTAGRLRVTVHRLDGEVAATVADGQFSSGVHRFTIDLSALTAASYFITAASGSREVTERVVVVR